VSCLQQVREGVEVKLLAQTGEVYVLAQSRIGVNKERSMRRRQLKWLCGRLQELQGMELKRDERLMKLGAAKQQAPSAWRFVEIKLSEAKKQKQKKRKKKSRSSPVHLGVQTTPRQAAGRAAAGRPLFITEQHAGFGPGAVVGILSATGTSRASLQTFEGDLAVRPLYHKRRSGSKRTFSWLFSVLFAREFGRRLKDLAPGLTPRSVLESWPRCK